MCSVKKIPIRGAIQKLSFKKINTTENLTNMYQTLGNNDPSKATICHRLIRFKRDISLEDEVDSGPPKRVSISKNVHVVALHLTEDETKLSTCLLNVYTNHILLV